MTLIVGFDSAWTAGKQGGIVAATASRSQYQLVSPPICASFAAATECMLGWKHRHERILVMLDQPTIVANQLGGRPVEKIVSSLVSRAKGGMQPANRQRVGMFCDEAPIWQFLRAVGGSLDPRSEHPLRIVETYPVLAMLGLGWVQPDGRLYKYNPERRRSFAADHWVRLCELLTESFLARGLDQLANWCRHAAVAGLTGTGRARKSYQDQLDAVICLHVGMHWLEGKPTLQVGTLTDGLIVAPMRDACRIALEERVAKLGWSKSDWLIDLTLPVSWCGVR